MKKLIKIIIFLAMILPIQVNASGRLVDDILDRNPLRSGADFTVTANNSNISSQEGLFSSEDDYGTTYFFRGTHALNNNVVFAGHQWKILRIEGNRSIRLIYNGVCPDNECNINGNTAGAAATIGNSLFNTPNNQNRFVGYMFGSLTGTFEQQHANTYNSVIKDMVDTWFDNLPQEEKLLTVNTQFCIDRSISSGTGLGNTSTDYGPMARVELGRTPILQCPREEDILNSRVGLISIDEAAMAGGVWATANGDSFLRTNQIFWTISPRRFTDNIASTNHIGNDGSLGRTDVSSARGVRPVISLNADVSFTGIGSAEDPYIITGLYEEEIVEPNNPEEPDGNEENEDNSIINPETNDINLMFIVITTVIAILGLIYTLIKMRKINQMEILR